MKHCSILLLTFVAAAGCETTIPDPGSDMERPEVTLQINDGRMFVLLTNDPDREIDTRQCDDGERPIIFGRGDFNWPINYHLTRRYPLSLLISAYDSGGVAEIRIEMAGDEGLSVTDAPETATIVYRDGDRFIRGGNTAIGDYTATVTQAFPFSDPRSGRALALRFDPAMLSAYLSFQVYDYSGNRIDGQALILNESHRDIRCG